MKLSKKFAIVTAVSMLSLAAVAQAATTLGQAGDIAEGKPFFLNKDSGIASYYKDGTSGAVTFTCTLWSDTDDNVAATLMGGKNFEFNPGDVLKKGDNGPYTWTLSDQGDTNGNIKIDLIRGEEAIVQCKQVG